VGQGLLGGAKLLLGALQAQAQHTLVGRFARRPPEQTGKVRGAEAGLVCQDPEGELLARLVLNAVDHALQLPRTQRVGGGWQSSGEIAARGVVAQQVQREHLCGALREELAVWPALRERAPHGQGQLQQHGS
jgi:hypothetical protein